MPDPISKRYHRRMNDLAKGIDKIFNPNKKRKDTGFVLLVFPFTEDITGTGRVNYISNAEREDVLTAMKEFIARAEGRYIEGEENDRPH